MPILAAGGYIDFLIEGILNSRHSMHFLIATRIRVKAAKNFCGKGEMFKVTCILLAMSMANF
jgi:hypothetical protein